MGDFDNPEVIRDKRNQLLGKYDEIKEKAEARRLLLADAKQFQVFKRNADELKAWLQEKIESLKEEVTKDNLEGKSQRAAALEAEKAATKETLDKLNDEGEEMKNRGHYASDAIQAILDELNDLFNQLTGKIDDRSDEIAMAKKLMDYYKKCDEVGAWIADKQQFIANISEKVYSNIDSVLIMERKYDDFLKDKSAYQPEIFEDLDGRREGLQRHPEVDNVNARYQDILDQWEQLKKLCGDAETNIKHAKTIIQFLKDTSELNDFLNEKRPMVTSDDYGRDLPSVEGLQRRHENIERDLSSVASNHVKEIIEKADDLAKDHPDHSDDILNKQRQIRENWEQLLRETEERRNKLNAAHDMFMFTGEHHDLIDWIRETSERMRSEDLPKDVISAEQATVKHQELKAEMTAEEDSFRRCGDLGQKLLSAGHPRSAEIGEKLAELERSRERLNELWEERKRLYDQCYNYMLLCRDVEQTEAWLTKQEAFLSNEDVGEDLDSVEALLKKHDDFEKTLSAQDNKITEQVALADALIDDDHYAKDDIQKRKDELLRRRDKLLADAAERRAKLELSKQYHHFERDSYEIRVWIFEKYKTSRDENYRDPTNLPGKMDQHKVFTAEIESNKPRVEKVIESGKDMIKNDHFKSDEIEQRMKELQADFKRLQDETKDKENKLNDAMAEQSFNRKVEDIELWMSEVEARLASDDFGKDLASCLNLIKKQQLLEMDVQQHRDHVDGIYRQAKNFVDEGHFDAPAIKKKQEQVQRRYVDLRAPMKTRKEKLDDAKRLHQLFRDIEEEENWIKEKEPIASNKALGKDLIGAQKLLKKHNQLMKEMKSHEPHVNEVRKTADDLLEEEHFAKDDIQNRVDNLVAHWNALEKLCEERLEDLEEATDAQDYFLEANEADEWMTGKLPIASSKEKGNNEDAVNSALKRHAVVVKEIDAYRSTIDHLADKAASCRNPDEKMANAVDQEFAKVIEEHVPKHVRELAVRQGDHVKVISSAAQDFAKVEKDGKQGYVPKSCIRMLPLDSPSSRAAVQPYSVNERQAQIEKQYRDLKAAADKRQRFLNDAAKMYQLMRDAQNVLNWLNKPNHDKVLENITGAEDEADADKLGRKVSNLQNSKEENEKKLKEIQDELAKMRGEKEADEEDLFEEEIDVVDASVNQAQNAVNMFGDKVEEKAKQLGSQHEVKRFLGDVEELKERIAERDALLKPGYQGKDLSEVQELLKRHELAQAQIEPLREKAEKLREKALKLADDHPEDSDKIMAASDALEAAYRALQDKADAIQEDLEKQHEFQQYLSQFDETMNWINGMMGLVASDELARDVNTSETLIERHEDLKNEMDAKMPLINKFYKIADGLAQERHPRQADIDRMTKDIEAALKRLEEAHEERAEKLAENKRLNEFNRDFDQNDAWMQNRETALNKDEEDVDVAMMKYEDTDKVINQEEQKILALQRLAEELGPDHYAAPEIERKKEFMITRWEELKLLMQRKKEELAHKQTVQEYTRDLNDIGDYIGDKLVILDEDSDLGHTNIPSKVQKQNAFDAELQANVDRIQATVSVGKAMLESNKLEEDQRDAISKKLDKIVEQYEFLIQKTTQKTARLKEANRHRLYYTAYKDFDFWLNEVLAILQASEKSNDLKTVTSQSKRHVLLEEDVDNHSERLKDLNNLADECKKSPQFDPEEIEEKREDVNSRFKTVSELSAERRERLNDLLRYHQLMRDISEEETWIREKRVLVLNTDVGKDLTGVHNLRKKHNRIENEIAAHERRITDIKPVAEKVVADGMAGHETVQARLDQLLAAWDDLIDSSAKRMSALNESQQFFELERDVEEEFSWVSEKQLLMQSPDFGDNLASVQGLIKKHTSFETDVLNHTDRANNLRRRGIQLIDEGNAREDAIRRLLEKLDKQLDELNRLAKIRKEGLEDNSAHLQFTWKADVVESWIKEKSAIVRAGVHNIGDLASVRTMLMKQETFETGLKAFENEGITPIERLKNKLENGNHPYMRAINDRYNELMTSWNDLLRASANRRQILEEKMQYYKDIEDKFLKFAKKASAFNSWFENAEEDLSDPIKCNSIEEIKALEHAHNIFVSSLRNAAEDLESLRALDFEIKRGGASSNPYTWFTMQALDETWDNLTRVVSKREGELRDEHERQIRNDKLRQQFAKEANAFHQWLTDTRKRVMEEMGTLEEQLDTIKKITLEVKQWRGKLKSIEQVGSQMGLFVILDNRYTEHSTVGLHQQWDQLDQLCQRMRQNLEQQLQAKETSGVSVTQMRDFSIMFRHHDVERTGKLNHADFKKCLRSLGYDLPMYEDDQHDPEFDAILDIVDPNRDGWVSLQDYMQFLIGRETENVQSKRDIEDAFRTLALSGQPFIKKSELYSALDPETAEFCVSNMKVFVDEQEIEQPDSYDYVEFCFRLFQK